MRILMVSPWLPHPGSEHAGGQYLFHMVRSLTERGHTVRMICYGRGESQVEVQALADHVASLEIATPAYTWRQKVQRLVQGGWRAPWQWGRRTHAEVRASIRAHTCRAECHSASSGAHVLEKTHSARNPEWHSASLCSVDVVHLIWTEMGRYLDAVPSHVATVLTTQDVERRVRPREAALLPPGRARRQARRRARQLIAIERRAVRAVDVLTAVSDADRAALSRLAGDRIFVTPPWLDREALLQINPETVVPGRLTFMGALDRAANVVSVRFLLDEIWPRIRAARPNTTLWIVGAHPPRWMTTRAEQDTRLVVTGWLDTLPGVWAETDVAVCPSLVGGGLLLKVAQPLLAGRPVVTTTLGNEGVAAPVDAIAAADTPSDYAAAVLALLDDRARWRRQAEAGRAHARVSLDWEHTLDALEAAYAAARRRCEERCGR